MDTADEILSQIPLDQLAQQLGVDEATAEHAVRQAVPALLGGMEANAQDPGVPPPWRGPSASTPGAHSRVSTSARSTPPMARRSSATYSAPTASR
jgi:Bacterial protein of unknown function (DUF937)